MIDRNHGIHEWLNERESPGYAAREPSQDMRKSFEEARRAARKRIETMGSSQDAEQQGLSGTQTLTWQLSGDGSGAPEDNHNAASSATDGKIEQQAIGVAPAAANPFVLAINGWSGRLVSGPWAGLEIHAAMHAGAITMNLRPASRQQHERLLKATENLANATPQREEFASLPPFPVQWEVDDYVAVD